MQQTSLALRCGYPHQQHASVGRHVSDSSTEIKKLCTLTGGPPFACLHSGFDTSTRVLIGNVQSRTVQTELWPNVWVRQVSVIVYLSGPEGNDGLC